MWLFERRVFVSKPSLRKELVCILKVVLVATSCVVIHDAHRLQKKENTPYRFICPSTKYRSFHRNIFGSLFVVYGLLR